MTLSFFALIAEQHLETVPQQREARIRELDALIADYQACAEVDNYCFWMEQAARARFSRDVLATGRGQA